MVEGDTFAIGALVRKRAELAGLIELGRAELETPTANPGHLDAPPRLCGPRARPGGIRPRAPRPAADRRRPEITKRMVLDALRRAGEPLGAREIATRLLSEMGAAAHAKLVRDAAESIRKGLGRQRARGVVACQPGAAG